MASILAPVLTKIILVVIFVGLVFNSLVLFLPSIILLPFSVRAYRWYNDIVISSWFNLFPFFIEFVAGTKIRITGDLQPLSGDHPTIVIANHITQIDWFFLISYLVRRGNLRHHRIITLKTNKRSPGMGWLMQLAQHIFVTRNWSIDKQQFEMNLQYYMKSNEPTQLFIFPEGTIFSESNKKKDKIYADKNGLSIHKYLLHPRTTGFACCVEQMKKYGKQVAICNLTWGMHGRIPQLYKDMTAGKWPSEVHIHVEYISPDKFLAEEEQEVSNWLNSCWDRKDKLLHSFSESGCFPGPELAESWYVQLMMIANTLLWFAELLGILYALVFVTYFWMCCVFSAVVFVCVSFCFGGFDSIVLWKH